MGARDKKTEDLNGTILPVWLMAGPSSGERLPEVCMYIGTYPVELIQSSSLMHVFSSSALAPNTLRPRKHPFSRNSEQRH